MSKSKLQNKIVLISGGGTGIGKAIAEAVINNGGKVVITGRRKEPLAQMKKIAPDQVVYIQADLSIPGEAKKVVDFTAEEYGRLDVLVNNAATLLLKPLVETTDEEIQQLNSININGFLSLSRESIPLLTNTQGSIISISSVGGRAIMVGTAAYAGTKAAVNQISRTLAVELGPLGIRVNVIAPGLTHTDMSAPVTSNQEISELMKSQTPLGRIGEPSDIASVVALLAGDEMKWVTGQVIEVSGGLML